MKYINAKEILPVELLQELQSYVQSGYVYIPAKSNEHRRWGEKSGYRAKIKKRNDKILGEYSSGASIEDLADKYYLSIHSIRKIIYR